MEFVEIEKLFDNFLLYDINIYHDDKLFKTGKLKMVTVKNHYIKFFVESAGSIKALELFYPFSFKQTDNKIIFDYKVDTVTRGNKLLNLKIANYILEDTPKVKEVIKIETQMKKAQEDITKTKKKDRNLNR